MSKVTPISQGQAFVMPPTEQHLAESSASLAHDAREDAEEAFDLLSDVVLTEEAKELALNHLTRSCGRLQVLVKRLNPVPSDLGAPLPRLAIEAGARLHGATPSTVAAGWPSCVQLRDLPERVRWAQYSAARLNRELMEREGFQFAEAFEAFNARIIEELGI